MGDTRCYVVADRGMWMIKFEDEEYGPFISHDDALGFALDAVRKLGHQGERAHVRIMEDGGHSSSEQSSGGNRTLAAWPLFA